MQIQYQTSPKKMDTQFLCKICKQMSNQITREYILIRTNSNLISAQTQHFAIQIWISILLIIRRCVSRSYRLCLGVFRMLVPIRRVIIMAILFLALLKLQDLGMMVIVSIIESMAEMKNWRLRMLFKRLIRRRVV